MKTIISFDIDGVLAQFVSGFVEVVNRVFPEKLVPNTYSPNDWNFPDILTSQEFPTAWSTAMSTHNFWHRLAAYQANVNALEYFIWSEQRHFDIYYLTSRVDTLGDSAFVQTSRWLSERNLVGHNTSLIVVKNAKEKIPVIKSLEIQASVDDYLPTIVASSEISGHKAFLCDRSWNREGRPDELSVVSDLNGYLTELVNYKEKQ